MWDLNVVKSESEVDESGMCKAAFSILKGRILVDFGFLADSNTCKSCWY